MLINFSIDNLSDGLSEQSSEQRLTSQVSEMLNCIPSPVYGVQRRPGVKFKGTIPFQLSNTDFFKIIEIGKRYFLMVVPTNSTICRFVVLDTTTGITSYNSTAANYFLSLNPARDIRIAIVGTTIFVVNRSVAVLPTSTGTTTTHKPNKATVYIKQGIFNIEYKIFVANTLVAHIKTKLPTTQNALNTLEIVDSLVNGTAYTDITPVKNLNTELPLIGAAYAYRTNGNFIQIYRTDQAIFDFRTEDGYADRAMASFFDAVQLFAELPPRTFYHGEVVQIVGDDKKSNDGFFMKFFADNEQTFGSGVWKETVGWHSQWDSDAPGELLLMNGIRADTMPHLIRYDDTIVQKFTASAGNWQSRQVGNEVSAPFPSFVTEPSWNSLSGVELGERQYINNVFFYQNRLGFLSGERVIMSKNDDYFDFFPHTASLVSEIDPIDVEVSDNAVNILYYAIPYGQTLVLFSDKNQFIYASRSVVSPTTIRIDKIASYTMNPMIEPVFNGGTVTFVAPNQQSPKLIQFSIDSNISSASAVELNSHMPTIIPQGFEEVCMGRDVDFTLVYQRDALAKIPVLKIMTDNNKIVQSAWSHWDFPTNFVYANFIDDRLVMLFRSSNGDYQLCWLELSNRAILDCVNYIDIVLSNNWGGGVFVSSFMLDYLYPKPNNTPSVNGRTQLLNMFVFSEVKRTVGFKARVYKKSDLSSANPRYDEYAYNRQTTMIDQLQQHKRFQVPIHTSVEDLRISLFANESTQNFAIHTLNFEGKSVPRTQGI